MARAPLGAATTLSPHACALATYTGSSRLPGCAAPASARSSARTEWERLVPNTDYLTESTHGGRPSPPWRAWCCSDANSPGSPPFSAIGCTAYLEAEKTYETRDRLHLVGPLVPLSRSEVRVERSIVEVVTYDHRMTDAAAALSLVVEAPA
jgi:hypothetical protein